MFEIAYARPSRPSLNTRTAHASLSRMLESAFDPSASQLFTPAEAETSTRSPSMDVSETDTAYTVVFDVPGVEKAQLKIAVEGRKLSLQTTVKPEAQSPTEPAARTLYRERAASAYARTVSLPSEVDAVSAQAHLTDGVLTLVLNKRVASGAVQVTVS